MGWRFTVAQFLTAIPESGGIVTTIAARVGCSWNTAQAYIKRHPTLQVAFQAEREKLLDTSEGVVSGNIAFAMRELQRRQEAHNDNPNVPWEQVDSDDAKWVLARLGKNRGYAERKEITGAEGSEILVKVMSDVSYDDL